MYLIIPTLPSTRCVQGSGVHSFVHFVTNLRCMSFPRQSFLGGRRSLEGDLNSDLDIRP